MLSVLLVPAPTPRKPRSSASPPRLPPAAREALCFEVLGTPAPKGSMVGMIAGARAVAVPGGSKVNRAKMRAFDHAVRDAARSAIGHAEFPPFIDVPLEVTIAFRLTRPGGHYGKGRQAGEFSTKARREPFPKSKPDVDKLARQLLDSLTGIVFDDDARIARLAVSKAWAQPGNEGASVRIASLLGELSRTTETSNAPNITTHRVRGHESDGEPELIACPHHGGTAACPDACTAVEIELLDEDDFG